MLDSAPPAWTRPHLAAQITVDLTDHDATLRAAKEAAAVRPVAGVLTYLEHYVELAARIARDLGLPAPTPEAVEACRDKAATRRLLAEHGVPSARSVVVTTPDEAVTAADTIGYPVVIKPRGMAGSAGVRRADTPADIRAFYQAATTETVLGLDEHAVAGVLVEEYLAGPEISVECVVLGPGRVEVVAVTRKHLGPEPGFQETGHTVDATDPLRRDPDVHAVAHAALEAVGITTGVMHVEMRLTPSGPRIVEINARLGGDLIPRLVELATGVSLPLAAARLATGQRPDLTETLRRAAAIEFQYPTARGRIGHTTLTEATAPWIERLVVTRQVGDLVAAPPHAALDDRLAFALVTGPDAATCRRRTRTALNHLTVHIDQPVHVTACVR
ncbi:ATP-grasp domain-containing protein [Streptomyces sp. NPDC014983]|uniref:ATP-grasp domain-containing protein n=1 Tax=Streptomyces sp. NPDC014983 TaxID=3364933 RepID=UPI0036FB7CB1